jgi:hypothetical protein
MSTDGDPDNHNYLSNSDDEVAPTTAAGGGVISTEGNCLSQQLYVDAGNEKKVLYLFCIGLNRSNNSNEPLFSFEQEPWSFLPKNLLRPRNVDYVHEITRLPTTAMNLCSHLNKSHGTFFRRTCCVLETLTTFTKLQRGRRCITLLKPHVLITEHGPRSWSGWNETRYAILLTLPS